MNLALSYRSETVWSGLVSAMRYPSRNVRTSDRKMNPVQGQRTKNYRLLACASAYAQYQGAVQFDAVL